MTVLLGKIEHALYVTQMLLVQKYPIFSTTPFFNDKHKIILLNNFNRHELKVKDILREKSLASFLRL